MADRRGSTRLARVVRVAPFWGVWDDLQKACEKYQKLIDRLCEQPGGGRAFFLHDFQHELDDSGLHARWVAAGQHGPFLYPAYDWLRRQRDHGGEAPHPFAALLARYTTSTTPWVELTDGAVFRAARQMVRQGLEQCSDGRAERAAGERQEMVVAQLNLFRVRLFVEQEHLERVLPDVLTAGDGERSPYTACIDLRFVCEDDHWCICATLTLWTGSPSHPYHVPEELRCRRIKDSFSLARTTVIARGFERVAGNFEWMLYGHPADIAAPVDAGSASHLEWRRPRLTVVDGVYRPASFWFVTPHDPPRRASAYRRSWRYDAMLRPLGARFLEVDDPAADVIAEAVVQDDFLVLRRFAHREDATPPGDEPTYLVLPAQGEPEAQEESGHRLVRVLSDLEWLAALALWDVDSDLEIAATHIEVYSYVAERAGVLLDRLVLHLPNVIWSLRLRRIHHCIELTQQTLLQGVADLALVTTSVQRLVRAVGDQADTIRSRFDRCLYEQRLAGRPGVKASLAERGLFEQMRERTRDHLARAQQVQTSYQSHLDEIALAFDERRVRETDVVERRSGLLAVVFGFFGLVAVLDALGDPKWGSAPDWLRRSDSWVVAVIGIGFTLVAGYYALWRHWRVEPLGSWRFRRRFRRVWSFLTRTSTDALRRVQLSDGVEAPDMWDGLDQRFCSDLAELWDELADVEREVDTTTVALAKGRRSSQWREVRLLRRRAEALACKALIVSERTPVFGETDLPRLTCLYRLLSRSLERPHFAEPPKLVADFDMRWALLNTKLPPECWEVFLEWERRVGDVGEAVVSGRVERLEAEQDPEPLTAATLLARILQLGIRPGLDEEGVKAVLRQMHADIDRWRAAMPAPP